MSNTKRPVPAFLVSTVKRLPAAKRMSAIAFADKMVAKYMDRPLAVDETEDDAFVNACLAADAEVSFVFGT